MAGAAGADGGPARRRILVARTAAAGGSSRRRRQCRASTGADWSTATRDAVTAPIRILLADDQALIRGAFAALIGLESDMTVVAQVGTGDDVVCRPR